MYFCATGLIVLLPFVYLFCQAFTFVIYEGRWRWWCLAPLPLVLAGFSGMFWVETPVAFTLVMIGAPTVGMIALACVWGLFSHSGPRETPLEPIGAAEGAPGDLEEAEESTPG